VPLTQMPSSPSDSSEPNNSLGSIELIPLLGLPKIKLGDNLTELILDIVKKNRQEIKKGDVLVVAHTIVSISEGSLVLSNEIAVSQKAERIALVTERKAQKVQAALDEATAILREEPVLITKTRHGFITDMSGVDESNAPPGYYILLPEDPDQSASQISKEFFEKLGFDVPLIIADTQGRPWRKGAANIAIGLARISPFIVNAGLKDRYNRVLRSSLICIADELASAAELLMGQADEGIPVVIVRGVDLENEDGSAAQIIRSENEDLFD
jgi:coenzyme F420-0:L-glutamate ligase/coenzyme F420-1:gamma-L-glutamate ligase